MPRLLANLGWTVLLIPLLYVVHVFSPKDHYGDSTSLVFIILAIPVVFVLTVLGLLQWRRQTPLSHWLLVVNVILLLVFTLPVGPIRN